MAGQSRRWMILLATVWIQAFTGTNFDFSSYSSELKAVMGISQVQLNYLAVASDLGKALGWSSGLALLYLPLPAVLLLAAALGFFAYGVQWLLITSRISLSYAPVFISCLMAGLSICWFNTVCFVLCIRNFSASRCLALSLTVSFNGVSAALYTLVAKAINGSPSSYLLLNAVLPVLTSITALIPILRQPPLPSSRQRDTHIFYILNSIAFLTGAYLLFLNPAATNPATSHLLLAGALVLLALPLGIPGIVVAREWAFQTIYSDQLENAEDHNNIHKELIPGDGEPENYVPEISPDYHEPLFCSYSSCCNDLMTKDRLVLLGEEHGAKSLISRLDFWIYYISYFCGGTIGLVYSNNLGQIAQSLGRQSQTSMLVNVYSSCSFFGRLFSAAPDLLDGRVSFARTGWLAAALVPMPLAFFLLAVDAEPQNEHVLLVGTALVGLSSGFVFAAAVSVTSELFGPESFAVNHNIVITNIPLGSQLYGLLAALVYDANGRLLGSWHMRETVAAMIVCMGRRCYYKTFLAWGAISMLGLAFAALLYLRTRAAYNRGRRLHSNYQDFR